LDIAIPDIKLGIEADGPFHMNPKSWARDKRRDAYLTAKGWKIVRFNNTEIQRDLWGVVKKIEKEINDRKSES
jgi:very-short-patch-repair endonuclease